MLQKNLWVYVQMRLNNELHFKLYGSVWWAIIAYWHTVIFKQDCNFVEHSRFPTELLVHPVLPQCNANRKWSNCLSLKKVGGRWNISKKILEKKTIQFEPRVVSFSVSLEKSFIIKDKGMWFSFFFCSSDVVVGLQ